MFEFLCHAPKTYDDISFLITISIVFRQRLYTKVIMFFFIKNKDQFKINLTIESLKIACYPMS